MAITAQRLRELLDYDPETGVFKWRVARGSRAAGAVAGSPDHGYLRITIDGCDYMAHRLAVLHVTGLLPPVETDHADRDMKNNRFANLRPTDQSGNQQNVQAARKNSSTGLLGVVPINGRFAARIRFDGSKRHLGMFDTPEAAHAAYIAAKRAHHPLATV